MSRVVGEPLFGTPVGPWFRWFAWHPVKTVDRGWRWLIPVYRRRYQGKGLLEDTYMWFHNAVTNPAPPHDSTIGSEDPT